MIVFLQSMSSPDKIAAARQKYLQLIDIKKQEINELEYKLRLLSEIESEIEEDTSAASQQNGIASKVPINKSYAKLGLTEAALDALIHLYRIHTKSITKAKVSKFMTDNGFIANGKNHLVSVDTALRRLAKRDMITSIKRGGKRIYVPKEEAQTKIPST
jgi:hypothetical protein